MKILSNDDLNATERKEQLRRLGLRFETPALYFFFRDYIGFPFYQYVYHVLFLYKLLRAFPNCLMHVYEIHMLKLYLSQVLGMLDVEGKNALLLASYSDLFVDVTGSNSGLKRVRLFATNLEKLIADDVHELMRSLPFLLRPVLKVNFLTPRARLAFPTDNSLIPLLLLLQDLCDVYWSHFDSEVRVHLLQPVSFAKVYSATHSRRCRAYLIPLETGFHLYLGRA